MYTGSSHQRTVGGRPKIQVKGTIWIHRSISVEGVYRTVDADRYEREQPKVDVNDARAQRRDSVPERLLFMLCGPLTRVEPNAGTNGDPVLTPPPLYIGKTNN